MKQVRRRAATIVAGGCLAAMLIVVPSAQAAITLATVTAPTDATYLIFNHDNPNTFAISGTSNGTTGDHVDLVCTSGDKRVVVASNVAVNANGSFSVPAADVQKAVLYRICRLRAVPAGTTPNDQSQYGGPRLYAGYS